MRERTRRVYAESAGDYLRRTVGAHEELDSSGAFSALQVQNYLFAELTRPCLNTHHAPHTHFCCVRQLRKDRSTEIGHELGKNGARRAQFPLPMVMFDNKYFLFQASSNRHYIMPFETKKMFTYHRRNLFVLRNLNDAPATVKLSCQNHAFHELTDNNNAESTEARKTKDQIEVTLEAGHAQVVLLSPGASPLLDEPVVATTDKNLVMLFYLADALP